MSIVTVTAEAVRSLLGEISTDKKLIYHSNVFFFSFLLLRVWCLAKKYLRQDDVHLLDLFL